MTTHLATAARDGAPPRLASRVASRVAAGNSAVAGPRDGDDNTRGIGSRLARATRIPVSIRWRLTIWYTVVVALTLSVFSLSVYWWLGNSLMRDIDALSGERARQVADQMARAYAEEQQAEFLLSPAQYLSYLKLRGQGDFVSEAVDLFRTPGVGMRVWNSQVRIIAASEGLAGTPRLVDYQPIVAALQGQVHRYVLETEEGGFYSYSYPALRSTSGRPLAVIQILTSLQSYESAMGRLGRLLAAGTLLVTAIALVTGAALSHTALKPINNITLTAQRINRARDLDRRIPTSGPRDEIRSLTDTVNEMLDRIQAMFDRQRQFMADVSHELRTPLTTIRGEVDLIRRTGRVDSEGLEAVSDEAERMSRLVSDLLLLARDGREVTIERAPVEMESLLLEVLRQGKRLVDGGRALALGHLDTCLVLGDRDRLKQLVLNLVQNALTHTPPGSHVVLSLHADGNAALVSVADDGPGIAPEALDRVFERFYRADKSRSRSNGGTGLGLAIVEWIATAHGGSVSVDSTVGRGTTFTARLPLAEDACAIEE
jgi:two-component system, OmpR family, sensor kinase